MPELTISPEKVCFVVMRARGIDAKEVGPGLGEGLNPSDQGIEDEVADLDVLDASMNDLTEEELRDAIASLNEDEQLELITLMRLGRDETATPDDWNEILAEVAASPRTTCSARLCSRSTSRRAWTSSASAVLIWSRAAARGSSAPADRERDGSGYGDLNGSRRGLGHGRPGLRRRPKARTAR